MPRPAPHDTRPPAHPLLLRLASILWLTLPAVAVSAGEGIADEATLPYASPVAVACSADGRWLATANRSDNTVSLIDRAAGRQVDRLAVGHQPQDIAASGPSGFLCLTAGGDLIGLTANDGQLAVTKRLPLGGEPRGIAVSHATGQAWVTRSLAAEVTVIDLETFSQRMAVSVDGLPRGVASSPDGRTVAVTCSGPGAILLCNATTGEVEHRRGIPGFNLGTPAFTPKGDAVFFPWTYDAGSHPSRGNIRRGWVVGSRLGRLNVPTDRETGEADELTGLTLDVPGRAVGDPAAVAVAAESILITAGGTHELLRLASTGLPLAAISGTDLINPKLAADPRRFRRLALGGRPQGLCLLPDQRRGYIANELADAVQEIDLDQFSVTRTISVASGIAASPRQQLVRRGEAIFCDAGRSLDQWYSCHTCHFEGGGNTVTLDTFNDGSVGSYKTVLPLFGVTETGPWTWHGWQTDLRASLVKSFTDTMQGQEPTAEDVDALFAYLQTLRCPPSPFQPQTPEQAAAVHRGQQLFASDRTGCTNCHDGPGHSGGGIHEVGLAADDDAYIGFNPPPLVGVARKTRWLHHGRARSLEDLLTRYHGPEHVSGNDPLTDPEVRDLVAFLKSL